MSYADVNVLMAGVLMRFEITPCSVFATLLSGGGSLAEDVAMEPATAANREAARTSQRVSLHSIEIDPTAIYSEVSHEGPFTFVTKISGLFGGQS